MNVSKAESVSASMLVHGQEFLGSLGKRERVLHVFDNRAGSVVDIPRPGRRAICQIEGYEDSGFD
jgi:hypothetical protein